MKNLTILLLLVISFTCIKAQDLLSLEEGEKVYLIVPQMPRYPGCEELTTNESDKNACASEKLVEFIYSNLQYPEEAVKNKTEGQSVAQFVVAKDGHIKNIVVIKELENGCTEETIRVINSMNKMDKKWIPGMKDGKAVNVKYTLPIRFRMED